MSNKAYIVAFIQISDFARFKNEYIIPSDIPLKRHGGKIMVASNDVIVREGNIPSGFGVILEFSNMENLNAFYSDPEYVPLIAVRESFGGSSLATVSQGMGEG
jgi:uncharacterized protein (DUF1330 family)